MLVLSRATDIHSDGIYDRLPVYAMHIIQLAAESLSHSPWTAELAHPLITSPAVSARALPLLWELLALAAFASTLTPSPSQALPARLTPSPDQLWIGAAGVWKGTEAAESVVAVLVLQDMVCQSPAPDPCGIDSGEIGCGCGGK
jgi:hypothetical protein